MNKRAKIAVIVALAVGVPLAGLGLLYWLATRDEPPPDDSDLRVHRLDISDEENGFGYFQRTADTLYWPGYESPGEKGKDLSQSDQKPDDSVKAKIKLAKQVATGKAWDDSLANELLAQNRRTLDLIDQAMASPTFQAPAINPLIDRSPYLPPVGELLWLLQLRGRVSARRHRYEEAPGHWLQMLQLGNRLEGANGDLLTWLVGSTTKRTGLTGMRELTARSGVPPNVLRTAAVQLASLGADDEGLANSLRIEYLQLAQIVDELATGNLDMKNTTGNPAPKPPGHRSRRLSPLLFKPNQMKRVAVDHFRPMVDNVSKSYLDLPDFGPPRLEGGPLKDLLGGNIIGRMLYAMLTPDLSGAITFKCQENVEVGATRVLLAMKAFQLEKGRLPQTLDELVPEYLDAVPLDDFDGKPLRYNREKKVVYSVGEDLKDDGGMSKEEAAEWWKREHADEAKDRPEPDPWQMPDPGWPVEF